MTDAITCDRCGNTASPKNRWHKSNYTVKYKSIHKPSTFIGARNRKFDLCTGCRRELDEFLGLERGVSPKELEDRPGRDVPLESHQKVVKRWREWAVVWFVIALGVATWAVWPL